MVSLEIKEKESGAHYCQVKAMSKWMLSLVSGSATMLSMQNENNPSRVKSMETPLILRFFLSLLVNWVGWLFFLNTVENKLKLDKLVILLLEETHR